MGMCGRKIDQRITVGGIIGLLFFFFLVAWADLVAGLSWVWFPKYGGATGK
jgi:hypothetical protein